MKAAALIEKEGIPCGVVNMRFVKPIDTALLKQLLQQTPNFVTVEDHVLTGGFGSAVMEAMEGTEARFTALVSRIASLTTVHSPCCGIWSGIPGKDCTIHT